MTDKQRHRRTHAPQGHVSNWVLMAFFAAAVVVAGFARNIL